MLDEKFDYGKVEIGHRLNINKPINHEKRIIENCIWICIVQKAHMFSNESYWEIQILYRNEKHKSQCDCLNLNDYTLKILHKGDMKINL